MLALNIKLCKVALVTLTVILISTIGHAQDWIESSGGMPPESHYQIGISIQYRTDNRSEIDTRPQFLVQLMKYTGNQRAWYTAFGYCPNTDFAFNSQTETYSLETGLRVQQQMRLFSPFFDFGLKHEYYRGRLDGRSLYHNKLGLSLRLGASLRLGGKTRLDFGLQHLLNSRESEPVYVSGSPTPPEREGFPQDIGLGGPDLFHLYNPTHLYLHYRFGL